jgi:tRNA G37 N-methylase Trm5
MRNVNPVSKKEETHNTILTRFTLEEKNKLEEFLKVNWIKLETTEEFEITEEAVNLTYDNFSYVEILKKIMPSGEVPNSYEVIGKIAHLNLREKFLPYKSLIGQLILDVKYLN